MSLEHSISNMEAADTLLASSNSSLLSQKWMVAASSINSSSAHFRSVLVFNAWPLMLTGLRRT